MQQLAQKLKDGSVRVIEASQGSMDKALVKRGAMKRNE